MKNFGDIAIEVMKKEECDSIGYENFGLLDDIADEYRLQTGRTKLYDMHPLDRHIAVLNRLEKDKRFEKQLMTCTDGRSERLVRIFYFKETK